MRKLVLYALLLTFIGPITYTFLELPFLQRELFSIFLQQQALDVVLRTFGLVVMCAVISLPIGVAMAWVNSHYDYPFKKIFFWLILTPLAIPLYVMGFIYYDFFYQSELLNFLGLSFSLSLGLIPYVYLLAYNSFIKQPQSITNQTLFLPLTRRTRFFKIHLPLARPALISAIIIISLEVLADFGTVSIYNYETISVSIYKYWYRYHSFDTAKWISFLLILIILFISFSEFYIVGKSRPNQVLDIKRFKKTQSYVLPLLLSIYLFVALLLPVYKLLEYSIQGMSFSHISVSLFKNTFLVSFYTALFSMVSVYVVYKVRGQTTLKNLLWIGYGVPGTFCAVAFVSPFYQFGFMDMGVLIMVLALSFRFIRLGKDNIDNGYSSISKSYEEALKLAPLPWYKKFLQVEFPIYKSFYFSGFLFIFVEVMKEMPIQLMTRPFYWQSFSIKIYEYTSEAQWELAAPLAIVLCAFGLIPIFLMHYYRGSKYEELNN